MRQLSSAQKTFQKIKKPHKRRWPHAVHSANSRKPCARLVPIEEPDFLSKTGTTATFRAMPVHQKQNIFKHYSLGTSLTPSPGGASFLLATSAMMCVSDVSGVDYGRTTEHHQRRLSRAIRVCDVVPLAGGTANYQYVRWSRARTRETSSYQTKRNEKKTEIQ